MIRLGILGSTRGTNLNAIVAGIKQKKLHASIELVASNRESAPILEKAANFGLTSVFVNPDRLSRNVFDTHLSELFQENKIDLIVLIGYMRILSAQFIANWQNKVINVHPSLLPAFSGLMDLDVHREVINSGAKTTGCTVHFVTEEVDEGPILLQKTCPVLSDDTPLSLKARVQDLEGDALIEAIQAITKLNC
ncbi:MAG: phosphoribosylglycinamide formyltransferase [Legionella sp.]|nr:phosphoribosylglycinamide formyltransferase [Legionella sp.]